MKNTFGQSVSVTLFGESHGKAIGAVIDGLAPGIEVNEKTISNYLSRRRPASNTDTSRVETDSFELVSGVFNGMTTGTPLTVIIQNENTKSDDYNYGTARPSHADYTAFCKYHGFEDYRGGGHFSGRITAALVAVGGIILPQLNNIGIKIGTHILECASIKDDEFCDFEKEISDLQKAPFPVINETIENKITEAIVNARKNCDSIGGIIQTAIFGIPKGVGEPWFDSVESLISHAVFSIGGIKGIEFGKGFGFAKEFGSTANDELFFENGTVSSKTNNNGGILGGITNGMPIIFNCAVKPTPSISKEQSTINFITKENTDISISGRHDPAIIRRICPVIDSVTAIVVCDLLVQRYGTDVLKKGVPKCNSD